MSDIFFTPQRNEIEISVGTPPPVYIELPTGLPGPPGPKGGPGVVAVPYDQWPPANPQPDVLYLRIAPV